jgi:hypothetical protein
MVDSDSVDCDPDPVLLLNPDPEFLITKNVKTTEVDKKQYQYKLHFSQASKEGPPSSRDAYRYGTHTF